MKKIIQKSQNEEENAREFVPLHEKNHLNTKKNVTLKPKFVKQFFSLFHNTIHFFSLAKIGNYQNLCPNKLKK